jgi:formamidopyrimidine-DNA glycosylase
VGRTFEAIARRGKWLRLELNDGTRLFSHLGMTGWWMEAAVGAPPLRFERARVDVGRRGRKASLRYVDSRRFGRLIATPEDIADWTTLGPDPLADGIDVERLSETFAKRRRTVKEILMDQRVLAGIGNVLATEALWMARIDPRSPGDALPPADSRAISKAIRRAIERDLEGRSSEPDDQTVSFFAYGRAGEPCPRCGTRLSSVDLGGRTSVFCRRCQKLRRR